MGGRGQCGWVGADRFCDRFTAHTIHIHTTHMPCTHPYACTHMHAHTHARAHTCTHTQENEDDQTASCSVCLDEMYSHDAGQASFCLLSSLSLSLSFSLVCVRVCARSLSLVRDSQKHDCFFFLGACVTLLCGHCFHTKCVRDSEKHDLKLKGYFLCPECREVIVIVGIVRTSSKGDCD